MQDWRKNRAMTASRKSHHPDSTFSQRVPSASNTRRSAAIEMESGGGGVLHSSSKGSKRTHKQGLSGSMTNEVAKLQLLQKKSPQWEKVGMVSDNAMRGRNPNTQPPHLGGGFKTKAHS